MISSIDPGFKPLRLGSKKEHEQLASERVAHGSVASLEGSSTYWTLLRGEGCSVLGY